MQVSKNVLYALALSVSVGTLATSCSKKQTVTEEKSKQTEQKVTTPVPNTDSIPNDNCPICGMG
jgi:hypothetical protein